MSLDIDNLTHEQKVAMYRRILEEREGPPKKRTAWGTLKDYLAPARAGDALLFRGKVYSGWKAFFLFDLPIALFWNGLLLYLLYVVFNSL